METAWLGGAASPLRLLWLFCRNVTDSGARNHTDLQSVCTGHALLLNCTSGCSGAVFCCRSVWVGGLLCAHCLHISVDCNSWRLVLTSAGWLVRGLPPQPAWRHAMRYVLKLVQRPAGTHARCSPPPYPLFGQLWFAVILPCWVPCVWCRGLCSACQAARLWCMH